MSDRLRRLRLQRALTQTELAAVGGVSRQLVGAIEAGRHLPRVDAALGLAAALSVEVSDLFGSEDDIRDVISGEAPVEGDLLRVGRVADRIVVSRAGIESSGWGSADAVIQGGKLQMLNSLGPGPVMIGCEPGLEVISQDLREGGLAAVAVAASSTTAVRSLEEGRAHIAVVHGAKGQLPDASSAIDRYRLCSWRVGLAASPDSMPGWAEAALSGQIEVVQREPGAGVQSAFERAATAAAPGPLSSGHVEAVNIALNTGRPAVTIEPAALAFGARFHALETHDAAVWVPREWSGDRVVEAALHEMAGARFQRRLLGIGGYDLERIGARET